MPEGTGPKEAIIREVVGPDSPYLETAVSLFRTIFPEDPHYVPYVRQCALQQSPDHPATFDHVWVVEVGEEAVGIRIFSYVRTQNFGHGAFVGLLEPYRGQGIGTWLVKQTLKQLHDDAAFFGHPEPLGYIVEVEPIQRAPQDADQTILERRMAFHVQAGGTLVDVDYIEPPMIRGVSYITPEQLTGVEPASMQLVFYGMHPDAKLSQEELVRVVEGLYIDVYRLEADSQYVQRAVGSILTGGKR